MPRRRAGRASARQEARAIRANALTLRSCMASPRMRHAPSQPSPALPVATPPSSLPYPAEPEPAPTDEASVTCSDSDAEEWEATSDGGFRRTSDDDDAPPPLAPASRFLWSNIQRQRQLIQSRSAGGTLQPEALLAYDEAWRELAEHLVARHDAADHDLDLGRRACLVALQRQREELRAWIDRLDGACANTVQSLLRAGRQAQTTERVLTCAREIGTEATRIVKSHTFGRYDSREGAMSLQTARRLTTAHANLSRMGAPANARNLHVARGLREVREIRKSMHQRLREARL